MSRLGTGKLTANPGMQALMAKLNRSMQRSLNRTYIFVPFKGSITVTKIDEDLTEGLWEGQYDYDIEDFQQDMDLSYQLLGREQDQLEQKKIVQRKQYSKYNTHNLAVVQSQDKLYVLGHCAAGSAIIASRESGGEQLTAPESANRLESNGLPKNRPLTMKLYSCEGGARGQAQQSFAQRLLRVLRAKDGYSLLRIQAYTKTITHKFKPKEGEFAGQVHKWAKDDDGTIVGRASDFRITLGRRRRPPPPRPRNRRQ